MAGLDLREPVRGEAEVPPGQQAGVAVVLAVLVEFVGPDGVVQVHHARGVLLDARHPEARAFDQHFQPFVGHEIAVARRLHVLVDRVGDVGVLVPEIVAQMPRGLLGAVVRVGHPREAGAGGLEIFRGAPRAVQRAVAESQQVLRHFRVGMEVLRQQEGLAVPVVEAMVAVVGIGAGRDAHGVGVERCHLQHAECAEPDVGLVARRAVNSHVRGRPAVIPDLGGGGQGLVVASRQRGAHDCRGLAGDLRRFHAVARTDDRHAAQHGGGLVLDQGQRGGLDQDRARRAGNGRRAGQAGREAHGVVRALRLDRQRRRAVRARVHPGIVQDGLGQVGEAPVAAAEVGGDGAVQLVRQRGRSRPVFGRHGDALHAKVRRCGRQEPLEDQARAVPGRAGPGHVPRQHAVAHVERPPESRDRAGRELEHFAVQHEGAAEDFRQRDHAQHGPVVLHAQQVQRRLVHLAEHAGQVAFAAGLQVRVGLFGVAADAHVAV